MSIHVHKGVVVDVHPTSISVAIHPTQDDCGSCPISQACGQAQVIQLPSASASAHFIGERVEVAFSTGQRGTAIIWLLIVPLALLMVAMLVGAISLGFNDGQIVLLLVTLLSIYYAALFLVLKIFNRNNNTSLKISLLESNTD